MRQDRDAAGRTALAGAVAALQPPVHVGIGFNTQFFECELRDFGFFFFFCFSLVCCAFFVLRFLWLLLLPQLFRHLLNISVEFSAEEFETALLTPNDTLGDIHMPLLKVGAF